MPSLLASPVQSPTLPPVPPPEERQPTHREAAWFWFRANCFKMRRTLQNAWRNDAPRLYAEGLHTDWAVMAQHRSPLMTSTLPAEFTLQAGKIQNLRLAARSMHRVTIPAGVVWSFWAHVGRPVQRRGFAPGREIREGCVIPTMGGGLCQLSNALHECAHQAGLEVVERHAHTRRIPGSGMVPGKDATVFWNYVDLRLKGQYPWQLETVLDQGELVVRIRSATPIPSPRVYITPPLAKQPPPEHEAESCESCGMVSCFRHHEMAALHTQARVALLVDEWSPEFGTWAQKSHTAQDVLLHPLDSHRWRMGNYFWNDGKWSRARSFPAFTLKRSLQSRRLASQGAARQKALLHSAEKLALLYARTIPFDAMHLVVAQSLLPYLWQAGVLGGRTFDVLLSRPSMRHLQQSLDSAAALHPESNTLADFRGDDSLITAEEEALKTASRLITPHRTLAGLAGGRGFMLDWTLPAPHPKTELLSDHAQSGQIIFPSSTLGRKGCYEVREAARELGLRVVLGGPVLEKQGFWDGVDTLQAGPLWWQHAGPVVLPSWVENQPRRLLQAVADGRTVITTAAAGIQGLPGVALVPAGDAAAIVKTLRA